MAVDIGPKIGVDGEKEYRNQINNIINQAKTLSSEMKSVTSSFDKNTSAQEKAEKQSEVLTKQIKVQEERVGLLSEMLAKSKEATGENSNETLRWQQAVNNATADLNNMRNKLDNLNDGLDETEDNMGDVADSTEDAGEKALKFGDIVKANVISDLVIKGFETLKNAVGDLASGLKDLSIGAAAYADDIMTMSTVTSLSTDTLQELTYMAELVDTDVSTVTGSMTKLTKSMYSAQSGSKSVQEAFQQLGVEYTNADGSLKSSEQTFWEIINALGNMSNETERDALAMTVLGKSAKELNPLIAAGTDTVEALKKEAHDLGFVLSDEQLNALGAVDDSYQRWNRTIEMVKNQIGVALAPAMETLLSQAKEWVTAVDWTEVGNTLSGVFEDIAEAIKGVDLGQFVKDSVENIKEFITTIRGADIKGFLKTVTDGINFVAKNGTEIAKVLGAVGVALAGMKLASFAKTAASAIGGIKTAVGGLKIAGMVSSFGSLGASIGAIAGPVGIAVAAIGGIALVVKNWGAISDTAKKLWNSASEAIKTTFTNMKESVTATVETLKTNISTRFEAAKAAVSNTASNLKTAVSDRFNELKSGLSTIAENIKTNLSNKFTAIKDDISSQGSGAKNSFITAFEEMRKGINDKAEALKTAAVEAAQKAANGAKGQLGGSWSWGADMMQGMIDGINSKKQALINAANAAAGGVRSLLHFSRPDEGPLRDYETWMPDMMKGLAKGIYDNKYLVEDALGSLSVNELAKQSPQNYNYGGITINLQVPNEASGRQVMDDIEEEIAARMIRRKAVFQ